MPKWPKLYTDLNSDTLSHEIVEPHFRASASIQIHAGVVASEAALRPILARAMAEHFKVTNRTLAAPDEEWCYNLAREKLERVYHADGGYEAAFEACRSGQDGGVFGVLSRLRDFIIREDTEMRVKLAINRHMDLLSYGDREKVAKEIARTFKPFMSPRDKFISEGEMAMKVEALIRALTGALDQARGSLRQI